MTRSLRIVFTMSVCWTSLSGSVIAQEHTFRVFQENGITIAETRGGPKYLQPPFTFEYLFALQQDDSVEESLLYTLNFFMVGEDGQFYVTDIGNQRIAVFNAEGSFSHSIGRGGEGPGELRGPLLLFAEKDTIAVFNQAIGVRRITYFNPDGRLIDSHTLLYTALNTSSVFPESGGRFIHRALEGISTPLGVVARRSVTTISADNDTIGQVTINSKMVYGQFEMGPRIQYWRNQGILLTDGSIPSLTWYNLDGSVRCKIVISELRPERVTSEERATIRSEGLKQLRSATDALSRRTAQNRLDRPIPRRKHYWAMVSVDEYGYIWATEPTDSYNRRLHGRNCRIISPDGEYLGDISWPDIEGGSRFIPSRGFLLAVVVNDVTGAQNIHVFRIKSNVAGLYYP